MLSRLFGFFPDLRLGQVSDNGSSNAAPSASKNNKTEALVSLSFDERKINALKFFLENRKKPLLDNEKAIVNNILAEIQENFIKNKTETLSLSIDSAEKLIEVLKNKSGPSDLIQFIESALNTAKTSGEGFDLVKSVCNFHGR